MRQKESLLALFWIFLRLGLTSFGGPVAHLGYFRDEFVKRRKWMGEAEYADLIALCQFLPGPSSSQVNFAIGYRHRGIVGGLLAWTGFTLPSVIALIAFGYGVAALGDISEAGWLRGLKIAAVAVVVGAVWGMGTTLCPDRPRATIAVLAAIVLLWASIPILQVGIIVVGALVGFILFRDKVEAKPADKKMEERTSHAFAICCLVVFIVGLVGLPILRGAMGSGAPDGIQQDVGGSAAGVEERAIAGNVAGEDSAYNTVAYADSFYRSSSLVFGGGHVVLPLLENEVVDPGWVTEDEFLAGYGAAQAVPGPLFTFAAYLGTVMNEPPNGWIGGLICVFAIFFPSLILVLALLPYWEKVRRKKGAQAALMGTNAAVVGILLAALYDPVWTSGIKGPLYFAIGLVDYLLLTFWKWPAWLMVLFSAGAGFVVFDLVATA